MKSKLAYGERHPLPPRSTWKNIPAPKKPDESVIAICKVRGGLSFHERSGLAMDAKTTTTRLREGPNYDVSRRLLDSFAADRTLTIRRVPLTRCYIIEASK